MIRLRERGRERERERERRSRGDRKRYNELVLKKRPFTINLPTPLPDTIMQWRRGTYPNCHYNAIVENRAI